MALKRIVLVMLLCVLAIVGLPGNLPKPALACSPGGDVPDLSGMFSESDIVIKATVQEVDTLGQNAIVRVEHYYKGTGGEHVVVSLNDPSTVSDLINGIPMTSCTYWFDPLSEGDTAFFLATREFDGSYFIGGNFAKRRFLYQSADQTLKVYEKNSDDYKKYTSAQLAARLTELGGKATAPVQDFRPNLRAPLHITTKNGTRYLLPVDGGTPAPIEPYFDKLVQRSESEPFIEVQRSRYDGIGKERCVGLNCSAYSPNGTSQYLFSGCEHDAVVFSTIGTFATWRWGRVFVQCQDMLIAELNTDADKAAEKLALYAQWSPDGRKFAYNDLKGLWVWEQGKKENNPRLIVPAGKTPVYARYFSPLGSYLAVSEGEKNYTLNLDTGTSFYDGLFSPTENYFLAFGTRDKTTGLFPVLLCYNRFIRDNVDVCRISEFGNPDADKNTNPDKMDRCCTGLPDVRQVAWIGDYRFTALLRPDPNETGPGYLEPVPSPTPYPQWDTRNGYVLVEYNAINAYYWLDYPFRYSRFWPDLYTIGFTFVYDRPNRSLALLKNDTTIMINDRDLKFVIGKDIDSPIAQIAWLPSLMYRDRAR